MSPLPPCCLYSCHFRANKNNLQSSRLVAECIREIKFPQTIFILHIVCMHSVCLHLDVFHARRKFHFCHDGENEIRRRNFMFIVFDNCRMMRRKSFRLSSNQASRMDGKLAFTSRDYKHSLVPFFTVYVCRRSNVQVE